MPVDDVQRIETVCRVFTLLERHELPGTDLLTEDASVHDAVFVEVGDEDDRLIDRFRKLLDAGPSRRVHLRSLYAAPGGRVLASLTAVRPGSAQEVGIVFAFDGARIRSGSVSYDMTGAFRMAEIDRATADHAAAELLVQRR